MVTNITTLKIKKSIIGALCAIVSDKYFPFLKYH